MPSPRPSTRVDRRRDPAADGAGVEDVRVLVHEQVGEPVVVVVELGAIVGRVGVERDRRIGIDAGEAVVVVDLVGDDDVGLAPEPLAEHRRQPRVDVLGHRRQPLRHRLFAAAVRQRIEVDVEVRRLDRAPHPRRIVGARRRRRRERDEGERDCDDEPQPRRSQVGPEHLADGPVAERGVEALGVVVARPHRQKQLLRALAARPAGRRAHERAAEPRRRCARATISVSMWPRRCDTIVWPTGVS